LLIDKAELTDEVDAALKSALEAFRSRKAAAAAA
jgi:hypothetical protein